MRLHRPGHIGRALAGRVTSKPASKRGKTVTKTPAGSQTDSPDHGCMPKQASLKWVDCRLVEFQLADYNVQERTAPCEMHVSRIFPASPNALWRILKMILESTIQSLFRRSAFLLTAV